MIRVLGHRGIRQRGKIDENSLPAFEKALKECDGIETDAAISRDGTPYLVHEISQVTIPHIFARARYELRKHLDRVSARLLGRRRLDQIGDKDVDRLRLKKGAKLPKLAELFDLAAKFPGKTFDIELKGNNSIGPVLAEINAAIKAKKITREQIILTSFDHLCLKKARLMEPDIKCGFLFARYNKGRTRIYPWTDNKESRFIQFSEKAIASKTAKEINPDYFIMTAGSVTPKKIKALRDHFPNAKIMIWTTLWPERDTGLKRKLKNPKIAPYIDSIITDYPDRMVKFLEKRGFRN